MQESVKKLNKLLAERAELESNLFDRLYKSILQEAIQGRLVPQIESEGTAEELLEEIRTEKQRLVKEGKLKKSAIASESRIFRGDDNKYYRKIVAKLLNIYECTVLIIGLCDRKHHY